MLMKKRRGISLGFVPYLALFGLGILTAYGFQMAMKVRMNMRR